MFSALVNRAAPECVFVSVMNNNTVTMSTGHAAVWDYKVSTANTTDLYASGGSGYGVTFAHQTATSYNNNPGLFAGIVAGRDIPPGDWGSVQVYGEHPGAIISGNITAPWYGTGGQAQWTNASCGTLILKPLGNYAIAGATITTGALGILSLVTSITQTISLDCRPLWPGGYAVPLGCMYNTTGTTTGTVGTDTALAYVRAKVFVKALA